MKRAKPQSTSTRYARRSGATCAAILITLATANASPLDDESQPPPTDPSAYYNPPANAVDAAAALDAINTYPDANQGSIALPNGAYGTRKTPTTENVLPPSLQTSFNYPTNGKPSPLFGAQPYTQQLLLFEEFGTEKLDPTLPAPPLTFPVPTVGPAPQQDPESIARSGPSSTALEAFMKQPGLYPFPTQYANSLDRNPWKSQIEAFLNRHPVGSPAEGRPPGKGWSHQRWNEFYPQVAFKTVQAGAKLNGGMRDRRQMHNYAVGEFAANGLYYQTSDVPTTKGTTKGIDTRFHPNMPIQSHKALWTFDGTFPPKLLMVRYGQPVLMRHYNALPLDPAANMGFGLHTISTHEHNGHNPAESDGYTNAFFFPGQYYDYRWPMQLAGYDTINTRAEDPRAAFPCAPGETLFVNDATPGIKTCQNGTIKIRGDWRETMSTHWFHDHMLDFTAQNVYKGNAVMMNYYSAMDRGNEALEDGVNLRLPSGSALPWGNRDYDVNLMIADKAWDKNGQLWFNPFNTDGFLGDQILVNWQYQPTLKVRARSYRFRILNGSVSRYFRIALVREVAGNGGEYPGPAGSNLSYTRVPFHMIGNDGNIMEHAVPFDGSMDLDGDGDLQNHNAILPTQGIAERFDIIVNFAKNGIKTGDKLYFVNLMEHQTGKGPEDEPLKLADVLSEKYKAVIKLGSKGQEWDKGDPVVGKFLQMVVQPYSGTDVSMNPADYEPAKPGKPAGKTMIPLTLNRDDPTVQAKLKLARHREFLFGRSDGTDEEPWTIKTDGGFGYAMDPRRLTAAAQLSTGPTDGGYSGDGTLEVWKIKNGGNGWNHPVHVHFEEGIVLSRDGKAPPEWEKWARKDVYRIGEGIDSSVDVDIAIRFREFAGTYMEHCHNTQHEDTSMLLRWDIERPGQFQLMPTPLPGWDGVTYVATAALPTFRTGGDGKDDDDNNKKPVANPDSATSKNGQAVTINVLANDTDPDGNVPLKVVGLNQPDSGKGTVTTDGTRVIYTPPATAPGPFTATFTYQASDAKDAVSEPATVSVAVTPAPTVNEDLVVSSASVTVRSNSRYTYDLSGTTSRGSGNTIMVTVTTIAGPLNLGAATLTPTGTGARWKLTVNLNGAGPSASPTATITSGYGKTVTAPISVR
ncbi:multicopper oxidase domain-containing protein [Pseudomonas sp. REP124]|uniref:Ig-like domain-containing protein n=1 Tax=Pseudomonas sp. REP124 TaxID=2875731 RepID=UPI001CCD58F7|nr:multicopper oxidase domain-containing protein [Pseudomonas sp. REP124]MBZ9780079.1 multicopper oxidase domain-containing protein [Pseudomonas sp. REP124]